METNALLTNNTANLPFQQQILQFIQQHSPQPPATFTSPSFRFPGFGNDAYRHVMQILATVGAPSSYTSHYNFLPYLPPLPPAPPSFTLVQSAFHSSQSSSNTAELPFFSALHSPPIKRTRDERENGNHEMNPYPDEDIRPARYDPVTGREVRPRQFDDENVAPIPSLVDVNLNMLKK